MRILLIGDLNSSFVREYALHLKHSKLTEVQIDLFATITPFGIVNNNCFNKVHSYPHLKIYSCIPQLRIIIRYFYLFFFILLRGRKYSHIHIHYFLIDFSILAPLFRLLKVTLIGTVFGSDLLKISPCRKRSFKGFMDNLNLITFANQELRNKICSYYNIDKSRSRICRFGLTPLDYIRDLKQKNREDVKHSIGLPKEKIIVCVGYNYNSNQQHLKILSALSRNQDLQEISDRLHFVFPLTYGTEKKYKDLLIDKLKEFPFNHTIFTEYLDNAGNASLRLSTDIMIQLQESDQLSGAMQEHLFSENAVITGEWLPYSFFDELGIYMIKISQVEEVAKKSYETIMNLNIEKEKCQHNPDLIYNASSWDHTIDTWITLYDAAEVKHR